MTSHRNQKECWSLVGQLVKLVLEMLSATTFILANHLLCVGLQLVAKHGRIDYIQEGEHVVKISVSYFEIVYIIGKYCICLSFMSG